MLNCLVGRHLLEDNVADLVVVVRALLLPARPEQRCVGVVTNVYQAVGAFQQFFSLKRVDGLVFGDTLEACRRVFYRLREVNEMVG